MRRAALVLLLALAACGGPRNYNQCILENVQPGLSNDAVRAVRGACRGEFPSEGVSAGDQEDVIGDGEIIDEPGEPVADSTEGIFGDR